MDSASSIASKTTPMLSKWAKPFFNYCQQAICRLASGSFYELETLLYISNIKLWEVQHFRVHYRTL